MSRVALASLLVLAGCRFDPVGVEGDVTSIDADRTIDGDVVPPDASMFDGPPGAPDAEPPDANPPGPCDDWTFAPANVTCTDPTGSWTVLVSATFNTDTGAQTLGTAPASSVVAQGAGGGNVRLVSVSAFSVDTLATLRVEGALPLVVLVDGTASILGTIDAAAQGNIPGAGGGGAACAATGTGVQGTNAAAPGGGGGGGGGFGAIGRTGGASTAAAGAGGGIAPIAGLVPLRGGCAGGRGGHGSGTGGGPAGVGGGAVQISARVAISIGGTFALGGSGGRGGSGAGGTNAGEAGGGGGSGGGGLLEAPTVTVNGSLCANGGAGGEGSGTDSTGVNGNNATCAASAATQGSGGSGSGGDGGAGSFLTTAAGAGSVGTGGGGGGGGGAGVGRLHIRGAPGGTPVVITPTATVSTL